MSIRRRGSKGLFTHFRRVPRRFASVETRDIISTALHTDNEVEARGKAAELEALQTARWEALIVGRDVSADALHDQMRRVAILSGFSYRAAEDIASGDLTELLARLRTIETKGRDPVVAEALLGVHAAPSLPLSALFDHYEALTRDERTGKSEDQLRRWRAPRRLAISELVAVIGDIDVWGIERSQALQFRDHLWGRVEAGKLLAGSANKRIRYLSAMITRVAELEQRDNTSPFLKMAFAAKTRRRVPFSSTWIREQILAPGALERLAPTARGILLMMIETGARPSELANLAPEDIHLDHDVPHIRIRPGEQRELKTTSSARLLPLVGVAIDGARLFLAAPERYRDKATSWSNLVNKYLRNNDLMESEAHSAYGLRHAFSDRLKNAGIPDDLRRELMGHADSGYYGEGMELNVKHKWLLSAMIKLPVA